MINKVIDLLYIAKQNGIDILLVEEQLQLKLPKNKSIDKNLLQELKDNKALIIDFLKDNKRNNNNNRISRFERNTINRIPLSFSQERLWFIDQLEGSVQYHIPSVLRLKGKLNEDALVHSFKSIINRHEILRIVIREEEGMGYQYINDNAEWKLQIVDGWKYKDDAKALQDYIKQLINKPFVLSEDYMLRCNLIRIGEEDHVLVVTLHHIASDGWSTSIIVRELLELYASYQESREAKLLPLPLQYTDYALWQRNYLQGEVLEKKLGYWKGKLEGVEPLQLPTDYNRPSAQSFKGAITSFNLDKDLLDKLQNLSHQNGTTLFMTLLAALNVLLHRYSGQQDICVGTPIAGRQQQELEGLIGYFINTLALRSDLSNNPTFTELLQQIKSTTLEAYDHQEVPFEKVVETVVRKRDISRSPLFQVMFVFQNVPDVPESQLGEVKLFREKFVHDSAKFDITFFITENAQGLKCSLEYCTDLYKEQTIVRMMDHFKELICSIVKDPLQNIGELRMLTGSDEHQLLKEFNDNMAEYPREKSILDLFEEQVLKSPHEVAVVFEDEQLTYQQLNERSNQLGHYLRSKGVKEETLVPICLERSIEMIVGILGILKSGGAYVPIDPEYPEERIRYMLEDTGAAIIVSSSESVQKLPASEWFNVIEIDGDSSLISKQSTGNLQTGVKPHHLAYIIYTSGSTGKPKGVMIEHRNVVRLFKTESPLFDFNEKDVWTMFHSFCFDFSVWEMYGALFYGGRLVIVPKHVTKDASLFSELLLSQKVTILNQTPSSFYALQDIVVDKVKTIPVRYVIFGGEALNPAKLYPWKQSYPDCRLINMYGITETTVHVTYLEIDLQHIIGDRSIIGKAIPTLTTYILDSNKHLVPIGIAGEIYVGGAGLARGYLNRPELTQEKFIKDTFSNEPEARLYKTGDLGRWLPDGNIEYLGRIDEQVKIRGYRIELGEIESVLQESELVRQSVVLARKTEEGSKRLVAYIVPEGEFDKEAIMFYLSSRLPDYMVPALWVELRSLPLTPNGKTDRKALPDPDASELLSNEYVAPRNQTEEVLSDIWKDLLHVERVGINDNFFELGGDSIITIQVVSRARRVGYELKPKDIFIHQTIGSLSLVIAERSESVISGEQGLLTGRSGLLPIQQWFFEGAGESVSHFNQSVLLSIDKSVTPELLQRAVEELMAHHDALRFVYNKKEDGQWTQEYGAKTGELITVDLQSAQKSLLRSLIKEHADNYQQSINIETGELVRFVLFQTPESEVHNRILIVIHHLAVDGVSWRILLDDLELLLTGLQKNEKPELGYKSSSYRQWYEALEEYGKSNRLLSQSLYWENIAGSYKQLPVDKSYPGVLKTKDIDNHIMRLDTVQTQMLLQEVPRVYHTEINDMLLCALAITLCEWDSREKVIIGMEGHGRESISENIDTSRTAGWFTSLYPVLLEVSSGTGVPDKIKSVKEQLRRIPDKGLGFGVLKYINKDKKLSGKQCWDIMFNYLGQLDNVVRTGKWLSGAGESRGAGSSEEQAVNYLISVNSMVQGGELILNWSYSSCHFEKETIARLAEKYQSTLELLIAHCIEEQKSGIVFTPSDYGLGSEMGYEELDRFLDEPFKDKQRRDWIEGLYRLSGLQQGMLFHALYDTRAGAYTEQLKCDLVDPDLEIISKSWNHVLNRHSILRSGFYYDEFSIPVQCVYRDVEIPVTILDYRDIDPEQQTLAIKEYEEADRLRGFDFKSVPLMRIGLIRLSEDCYRMIWTSHHILFDGWSIPIIMEEFLSAYELLISGKELVATEDDRYEDYIRYIERVDKDQQEIYWRKYMKGVEQSTLLPFIGTTAQRTKGIGTYSSEHLELDAHTTVQIERYAQKHHVTVNTVMQGVWSYLLHRYTGGNEVVYGIIVSGRPDDLPGVEQRVGIYINTLPLHSTMQEEQGIAQWLQDMQNHQVSSRQYQYTPLQEIQKWTGVSGDLFDSLLVFENYPVSKVISSKKWSLGVQNMQMQEQTNYPLTIIIKSGEKTNINFSYNEGILNQDFVNEIRNHFEHVLFQIIVNGKNSLNEVELLTGSEKHQLLVEFNDTEVAYPKDKTIIDLFGKQVQNTPENIALVFEEHQLTYQELNERSNQLAHYLKSKGMKAETLVPVCMERSIDLITGILGILKAGGAYVPVDPEYPEERIRFIIEDTGAKVILSSRNSLAKLPDSEGVEIISLDDDRELIDKQKKGNLLSEVKAGNLAYVIYTSGSTGKPKGVMVEHSGVVNLVMWHNQKYEVTGKSRSTTMAGVGFDAFGWEVFPYLLSGATLYVIDDSKRLSPVELAEVFIKNKITHSFIATALAEEFINASRGKIKSLKYLLTGGDKLPAIETEGLGYKIVNNYGPTENTVVATSYELSEKDSYLIPPIGKPISNNRIYIVNKKDQLTPIGVAGEICISGSSLSRGYLNLPELTKEKFIKDPFSKETEARLYRTGDLGRWLADGNIEYLGRIDEQVKVRGFRIELGEIESVIQESDLVQQSVVVAKEDEQNKKRLVAYVVVKDGKDVFDKEALVLFLKSRLPEYMIPALWVEMESLPLTPNGKIDRKSLPDPDASELLSNEYVAPRNEQEEKLAQIWKDLLHAERVGINDNFFELGGDSIITIQVVSRARRAGYELKPKDIFIHQTISSLSAAMAERSAEAVTGEQGLLTGKSGLLPIQQWYFEGAGETVSHFNQALLLSIDKSISPEILSRAVEELTAHHDALRFNYHKDKNGQWIQEYGTKKGKLITVDLRSAEKNLLRGLIKEQADKFQRSLDIEKGEIARFVLIQTPEKESKNRIFIVIHHLAIDGVSWRILLDDLELLLTGHQKNEKPELGFKSSSYRQWYEVLQEYGRSKKLLSQSEYWEQTQSSYEPLPVDTEYKAAVNSKDIRTETMRLDSEQTQLLLQEVPRVYHTEINDMLLCALAITLCEWSSKEKITIGLEGHGRESISEGIDSSRTVGWFTSVYPVLLHVTSDNSIAEAIKSVKEQLRRVPEKGLGYGVLKYINKQEKLSGKECWDIVFNYLGQLDNVVNSGKWLSGAGESRGAGSSEEQALSYLISVNGMVQGGELILNWGYSSCHFEKETIAGLAEKYLSNLNSLIAHCVEQQKSGIVFTPSDYGLGSEMGYEELDRFLDEPFRDKQRRDWVEGLYRLSGLQEGMLFHGLYDTRAGAYIEQFRCDLNNPDLDIINQSWNHVLSRHSILRSGFYYDVFNIPVQCVYREVELPVTILDYRDMDPEQQALAIKEYEEADRVRGFDFKSVPLMRIGLIRLSEDNYRMLWTSHHILFDAWSLQILIEEFLSTYELLISGKELSRTEDDRYEDYIRYIERGDKDRQEMYWRNYMKGVKQSTLLPFIGTTTQRTKGIGIYSSEQLELDAETAAQIERYAQKHRVTVNTVMQGVWSYLLHRYTGSDEVVYGVIVSGRPDDLPGVEQRVGIYINTLPLHSTMQEEQGMAQWLQDMQNHQVSSRQYQYTPLQEIQKWTGVSGDLFDSLLLFENYPVSKVVSSKKWSLGVQNIQMHEQTNYPLTITVVSSEKININFSYNKGILNQEYVNKIRDHFENVLLQIVANENSRLNEIEMLTGSEKHQLLVEFNETEVAYPKDKTIIDLFEEQVLKNPDKTALVFEEQQLTFKELNDRSNQLAHYLRSKGVKEETIVPICIERSIEMIVGIFGILKSGGAYVPIDPEYPEERIRFMLEDTEATMIVTSKKSRTKLSDLSETKVIELDGDWSDIKNKSTDTLSEIDDSNQLAYVIYTSGSTGKPKGVMVEHRSLVNLLLSISGEVEFNSNSVFLSVTTFSFDICYLEIFMPLINGGKLIIASREVAMDGYSLAEKIASYCPTHMQGTPSTWQLLMDAGWQNKETLKILIGGEALKEDLKDQLIKLGDVFNLYGPTETTIWSTIKKLENNKKVLIGAPIANTQIQILNRERRLVPVGVTGEILIGGLGLARGYLNRKELTAQKFIADQFCKEKKTKMYKTGDLGRWLPDGNIEYLGRMDEQVKIRGYRIELGEIESVLQKCDLVRQAVVLAHETKEGGKRLVGYVKAKGLFNKQAIISHLKSKLPEYMIPALWVEMETLPLTSNGKINRKALPDPDASQLISNEYIAPQNELEMALVGIWQNLLDVETVGINDNFFELGGHSLLALRLFGNIEKLTGRRLAISTLFNSSTIKELAAIIKDEGWTPPWKSLIPIKPEGSRLPFFCVPPATGTALHFRQLLKYISADQPFYVLESIGLDGKERPHTDLKEMAAFYVKEVQLLQPKGPYLLGGRCFGGRVVFEMAQQLRSVGQKVALLAVFDTWPPFVATPEANVPQKRDVKHFVKRSFHHIKKGEMLTVAKKYLTYVFFKTRNGIRNKIDYLLSDEKKKLFEEIKLIHFKAQDTYIASKYHGKITLIESGTFNIENRDRWKNLAEGGLESYFIPGTDHRTIMSEPHIRLFAEKLNHILEKAHEEIENKSKRNGEINKSFLKPTKAILFLLINSIFRIFVVIQSEVLC